MTETDSLCSCRRRVGRPAVRSGKSTVEPHCKPATGSSIIMVIFRWPSALHTQRAEKEIEQRESHGNTAEGKGEERKNATLKVLSYQRGRRFSIKKKILESCNGPDCLWVCLLLFLQHEITVQGGKNFFVFFSSKALLSKYLP